MIWLVGVGIAATIYLTWAAARAEQDYWSDLEELWSPGDYVTMGCLCARGWRQADEVCTCGWYR